MNKLFIFATFEEAKDSIDALNVKEFEKNHFVAHATTLVISGMGAYNAMKTTLLHGASHDEIYNCGIVGAINNQCEIKKLYTVSLVGKYQEKLPHMHFGGSKRLLTVDAPLHNAELKKTLSPSWDLVDMEGYGIASAAKALGKPLHFWKVVSDFAEEGGSALIKQNLAESSKLIASSL